MWFFGSPQKGEGLPARVRVIPVPWEPTSRFRGTASAPGRIAVAARGLECFDLELGDAWTEGIAAEAVRREFVDLDAKACEAARPVIEAGGPGEQRRLHEGLSKVELASERINEVLSECTFAVQERGGIPAVLGGDASVQFAAIREGVRRFPKLGVLHIGAHARLKVQPLGFTWAHDAVMENVLTWSGLEGPLVQVGTRQHSREEWERMQKESRIHAFPWSELAWAMGCGASWEAVARPIIEVLPDRVWISMNIDGLNPSLCPRTPNPVPGGLSWDQLVHLLRLLRESGRRVVGVDLVSVGAGDWDAAVGARVLYQLCATAILTHR